MAWLPKRGNMAVKRVCYGDCLWPYGVGATPATVNCACNTTKGRNAIGMLLLLPRGVADPVTTGVATNTSGVPAYRAA